MPAPPMPNNNAPRPRTQKQKSPRENDDQRLLSPKAFFAFVIIAIGLIVWMIAAAPKQKRLACDPSPNPSLIEFGRCTEE